MTRARCIRLLALAALLVFVAYVFSPCTREKRPFAPDTAEAGTIPIPGLAEASGSETAHYEIETLGAYELADAFNFESLIAYAPQLLSTLPSWSSFVSIGRDYGAYIAQDALVLLASVILSQLPLLTSPRRPARPRLCRFLAVLLLFCAVGLVCTRVDFLIELREARENISSGLRHTYLAFGAWLAPPACALAGAALFLRSKADPPTAADPAPHIAPSFSARLRSLAWPRRLTIAALVIFVAYLYCPIELIIVFPEEPKVASFLNGIDELRRPFVIWLSSHPAAEPRGLQGELALIYESLTIILPGLLLLPAGVIVSQLPLLTSPRTALRPRLCWALAIVLVLIAVGVAGARVGFMVEAAGEPMSSNVRRLTLGAWLAPLAALLAAAAVLVRRKEVGTESESGK